MFEITRGLAKAGGLLLRYGVGLLSVQGAPTNGAAGTFANIADKGSLLFDQTNAVFYMNTNTKASPTWTQVPNGLASSVTSAMLAAASVTTAKLDPTTIQMATLTLTNAQIKALRATPQTLVAAPGAGKVIVPMACYVGLVYGGTNAFTAAANDNLGLKYKDGTTASLMTGAVQAFIQAVTSSLSLMVPAVAAGSTVNITKANSDNQPLVVHNITAGEIAGNAAADNTMVVTVSYTVQASGL